MVNRYIENPCSPYRSPMYPDAWGTRLQSVLLSLEKSLASVKTYKGAGALMASKGSDRGKSIIQVYMYMCVIRTTVILLSSFTESLVLRGFLSLAARLHNKPDAFFSSGNVSCRTLITFCWREWGRMAYGMNEYKLIWF